MNTVFKAGYQAFLLLGLAAGCALPWAGVVAARARAWTPWAAVAAVLLLLGLVYPYAGSYARTGGFANAPTLDGLKWLKARSPGDPGAIDWLRANAPGDAVVLEAFGDDYSAFGHARISTFTGRATVIGWAGHELQWQHDPGPRTADVQTLYTTPDVAAARRADRPLRHPLRRRRPDRADDLRRRGRRQVGPARPQASTRAGGTTVWDLRRRLLDVEPFLHPARGVPHLALR